MARRRSFLFTLSLLLVGMAPACPAAQYTLSNSGLRFAVPDGWPRILQSPGDPEMQVFQDPDPSSTSQDALARVTVVSQSVPDIASFQALIGEENNRAQALPHYRLDKQYSSSTRFHYTATDGNVAQAYDVRFYLHNGHAVEVRCVRPAQTQAGAGWTKAFDAGCDSIANSLR